MPGKRKTSREKDLTSRYLDGEMDEDRIDQRQQFSQRAKHQQANKIIRTTLRRAEQEIDPGDVESLPIGLVMQIFSQYVEVLHEGVTRLCGVRKTLTKTRDTFVVVGDLVRFRDTGATNDAGQTEAIIEQIMPRKTLLTRSDSFKAIEQHPIVANAEQMLIVASVARPKVKWGLIDRMLIAAQGGGLSPILCLNKVDLRKAEPEEYEFAESAATHYASLHVTTLRTSVEEKTGLEELRQHLRDHTTVLAGHSGVGKSSLIRAIQPHLESSCWRGERLQRKGRHTTSSSAGDIRLISAARSSTRRA